MTRRTYVLSSSSRLWWCVLFSSVFHGLILIVLFMRFDPMGFKKGTSNDTLMKVAGFQILGNDRDFQEMQNQSSSVFLPSSQSKNKNQTKESFDLDSLSLYDGKNNMQAQSSLAPSHIKALARFPRVDSVARNVIEELYGEEFGDYGLVEQEFLVNNLKDIGRITQRYLQYPSSAVRLGQEGISAVEFYLHPNGNISELKIILSSDYILLDRNSERTIEIAYKDYPHPRTKTKIRIFVSYGLYRRY